MSPLYLHCPLNQMICPLWSRIPGVRHNDLPSTSEALPLPEDARKSWSYHIWINHSNSPNFKQGHLGDSDPYSSSFQWHHNKIVIIHLEWIKYHLHCTYPHKIGCRNKHCCWWISPFSMIAPHLINLTQTKKEREDKALSLSMKTSLATIKSGIEMGSFLFAVSATRRNLFPSPESSFFLAPVVATQHVWDPSRSCPFHLRCRCTATKNIFKDWRPKFKTTYNNVYIYI